MSSGGVALFVHRQAGHAMMEDTTAERLAFLRQPLGKASALVVTCCAGVLLLVFMIASGQASGELAPICEGREDRQPGKTVFDFVAHLPMSIWLYCAVGLIALLGVTLYCYQRWDSKSTAIPEDTEDPVLFVAGGLRRRALALRARAAVFLGSSIMLLLGGVYITIWVVPMVPAYDTIEQGRALLQFKHVDVLDAIRRGHYWLYTGDVEASDNPTLRVFHNENGEKKEFVLVVEGNHVLVSEHGLGWERHESLDKPVEVAETSAEELRVRFGDESTQVTKDGGITWSTPASEGDRPFDDNGSQVPHPDYGPATFADDGKHGAVVGTSIFVDVQAGRESWYHYKWHLPLHHAGAEVEVFEFDAEGEHGLIGTRDRTLHVTADGGETWTTSRGQDIGLNRSEWAVAAAIGSDGLRLVVGDEGSVRVRDGDSWTAPEGLDEWRHITLFEFGTEGQHGLVGARDGTLSMTADGGKTWRTWTSQEVGFRRWERAVGAAIGSDGAHLVVGDEGTVRVRDGDGWAVPEVPELPAVTSILVAKFGADGHRLIVARDGTLRMSADDGKTWTTRTLQHVGSGGERVVGAAIGRDGEHLVVGNEGTLRIWDGDGWAAPEGRDEWPPVTAVEFIGEGRRALLRTGPVVATTKDRGSTWDSFKEMSRVEPQGNIHVDGNLFWLSTTEGAATWTSGVDELRQVRLEFEGVESIAAIALNESSEHVVVGTRGATLIDGRSEPGRGDLVPRENEGANIVSVVAVAGKVFALVEGEDSQTPDSIYVRGEFPDLADDALTLIRALQEDGQLRRRLVEDAEELSGTLVNTGEPTLIDQLGIDQVHWLRAVTTLATVYLVQLFVGLYRYSVRLAAFWDSRADAVLLGTPFRSSDLSFGDLMAALAPDALDFKPPRYPSFPPMGRPYKPGESP